MELQDCPPVLPTSFYKIILPGVIRDKELRIPDKFAETYGDELSGVVTLVIPDGSLWPVKLDKSDNMLCFSDGWQKLVDRYSICSGNVLIFKYMGNSCFNVVIFDITSTDIDYSCHATDEDEMECDLDSLTSQMSSMNYCPGNGKREGEKVMSKLRKGKEVIPEPRVVNDGKVQFGWRKRSMTADETKKASTLVGNGKDESDEWESLVNCEEAAAKLGIRPCFVDFIRSTLLTDREKKRAVFAGRVFTSEKPSFMAVVRQSNLYKAYQMDAPVEFSASYLLPGKKVELEIADGRRWTAYSTNGASAGVATLKKGWVTFAKANRLAIGDICIFEVVRVEHVVLKVSIFRSNQD